MTLPAGSYVVTGQTTLNNTDSGGATGTAVCFLLRPGGTFFAVVREGLGLKTTFDDRASATPVGALTLTSPTTITLSCGYDPTAGASVTITAADRRLVAVQVGTLTGQ